MSRSGAGRLEAGGETPSDRGEQGETQKGGDGENPPEPSRTHRGRVGPDPHGDGGASKHQRSGRAVETKA